MKNISLFIGIAVILLIGGILISQNLLKEKEISMPEKNLEGKKIVIITAFQDFRDEEYFVPKEILEKAGAEIKTASNQKGTARGADGGQVQINLSTYEIDTNEFDAVVFIGGPGCLENLDNEDSYQVAKATVNQNKVLASICISPVILAKAGVLSGKKATVWTSLMDKSAVKILEDNGAVFENKSVVVDGKIITASGPDAAREFGQKIVEALTGK